MLAMIIVLLALLSLGQEPSSRPQQLPVQQPTPSPQATASPTVSPAPQRTPEQPRPEEPPVITKHEIKVGGKTLRYIATVGLMPIKNREGETEARMFFMAYTLDDGSNRSRRPLTFSFNGGPGSASVWLHLGRSEE